MTFQLRDYQAGAISDLFIWWDKHPGVESIPILVLPTAAGKSVIVADLVRQLFAQWPEYHPRTLVLVPSKELAEQNAEKLIHALPHTIAVDYYSASVGRKNANADVIVATIGSVANVAHLLGNICCVLVDECHLINPDGAGMYRTFLRELAKYCQFRTAGLTATPFRGNGVWLTDGKEPLFTGIATEVKMSYLLSQGFLSPLIRPVDVLEQISTDGVATVNGDFHIGQLSEVVDAYIESAADQACELARERRKWIAFCPTVANAEKLCRALVARGIGSSVVTGETPKADRMSRINAFRQGRVQCLVSVLALSTGFDVPDVDCVLWLRPTKSPVLYVQGAGRGMRIAPGKKDCLWLDFSDTTSRLGPIDQIRGRAKTKDGPKDAPFAVCDNCGAQVRPASLLVCPDCGHALREVETERARQASNAAVMSSQIEQKINRYEVTDVEYERHSKPGSPPSLRVEYWAGMRRVAREWVCLSHTGYAQAKAHAWWVQRSLAAFPITVPDSTETALKWLNEDGFRLAKPHTIHVNETSKFPEIVSYDFDERQDADQDIGGPAIWNAHG